MPVVSLSRVGASVVGSVVFLVSVEIGDAFLLLRMPFVVEIPVHGAVVGEAGGLMVKSRGCVGCVGVAIPITVIDLGPMKAACITIW